MPSLVGPALPEGSLRAFAQPTLPLDDDVVLRPWDHRRDVPSARRAFDDPDIQFWHTRRLDSDDEARAWLSSWRRRWSEETDASWAIARADSDVVFGQVGLRTVFLAGAQAQLSYWIVPEARRQGWAARSTEAVVRWSFLHLGLKRLYLLHSVRNTPSCAVATTTGFALEGTLQQHMLHSDGWHDFHIHARISPTV